MRRILLSILMVMLWIPSLSQNVTLSGRILEKGSRVPVEFATVVLPDRELWAVADAEGRFTIKNVPQGKTRVEVSCLGYVTLSREMTFKGEVKPLELLLDKDNLTLEDVVITAKDNSNSATTTRTIDKAALEQVQMMNVSDISSLLPGGATPNSPLLTSEQSIILRGATAEAGNPAFGTAIEVDGVRLSNNASFVVANSSSAFKGVATNSIASANVESVEVITGVPSVEYGDMTNGVVKVNTKKGKAPWAITLSTSPNSKQASVSRGFALGTGKRGPRGVINASAEYTRSVSNQMSPYTAYDRRQISLIYSNLFSRGTLAETPIRFSVGVTGNLGGMDSSADPDMLKDTWSRQKDNAVRANFNLNWLLNRSWLTSLEASGSVSYADKEARANDYYSSAASTVSLHALEEGYFIAQPYSAAGTNEAVLIPRGVRYNEMAVDDRPLSFKLTLKANQASNIGNIHNKVKLGGDFSGDYNFGVGQYTLDMATAPSFREYRYCDKPWMYNAAVYIEESLSISAGRGNVHLIAGLRNDNTIIRGSDYGVTSSFSPRLNAKYIIIPESAEGNVSGLVLRASWGMAVKQPSYAVLFPQPTYRDYQIFASTTASDGSSYVAWLVKPRTTLYNPDLKWQRNDQSEVGIDVNVFGHKLSLSGYYNITRNSYRISNGYEPMAYNYTLPAALTGCVIPADDRVFSIDRSTGVVTVSDRTGKHPSQTLAATPRQEFISYQYADNMTNPIRRYGVEWVLDFKKIKSLNTKFRLDGSWYSYRSLDTDIKPYYNSNFLSMDRTPYKYVGYFYGGNTLSNGSETSTVRTNLTVTTNVPKVRLIFSLKLESTLLRYSHSISERLDGGRRSYVLNDRSDLLSISEASIYDGDIYTIAFPDYYVSVYEPDRKIDFLEAFKAAKQNNPELYGDLSKLVEQSSYTYTFKKDFISPYFSANFSVTKELGEAASISFYANNFFNNIMLVKSSKTGNYSSPSSYIPKFYYGLTVRFKFN